MNLLQKKQKLNNKDYKNIQNLKNKLKNKLINKIINLKIIIINKKKKY